MDLYANMSEAEKRERLAKTCCYTSRGEERGEAGEHREEGEEKGERKEEATKFTTVWSSLQEEESPNEAEI